MLSSRLVGVDDVDVVQGPSQSLVGLTHRDCIVESSKRVDP